MKQRKTENKYNGVLASWLPLSADRLLSMWEYVPKKLCQPRLRTSLTGGGRRKLGVEGENNKERGTDLSVSSCLSDGSLPLKYLLINQPSNPSSFFLYLNNSIYICIRYIIITFIFCLHCRHNSFLNWTCIVYCFIDM